MNIEISGSIVLFNNEEQELLDVVSSFLACSLNIKLFLIDNSLSDRLKGVLSKELGDKRIEYIHNPSNPGYGSGHNIGIEKSLQAGVNYHLVMNPDIKFKPGTLESIYNFMEANLDVGSLMPKVLFEDGSLQRLCKLLPTPFDLIGRRFLGNTRWAKKQNEKYELHSFGYDKILNTPCLSGCFMFVRNSVFEKAGLFDPRYFMYLEDYDLNRRINKFSKTIFYPEAVIIHGHAKESYKSGKLLKIHIQSAIKYFNKWGWLVDKQRTKLNNGVLEDIRKFG